MSSEYALCYGAIGALGAMSFLLGFRMSLFRLAGSPGENDPKSALNKWYLQNQLHAEWAPVGGFLILALVMAQAAPHVAGPLAVAFTASRMLFVSGKLLRVPMAGQVTMTVTYLTTAAMSGVLLRQLF